MNVLGLSFGYHDAAAAIVVAGQPIAYANEERFSFKKNDARFPIGSIRQVLNTSNLSIEDLDMVVYYEDPHLKADRVATMAKRFQADEPAYLEGVYQRWSYRGSLLPLDKIESSIGVDRAKVQFVGHHESHAALAYFCSPFDRALVLTIDGVGEYETLTAWIGEGCDLRKIRSMTLPNSVGLLYSAMTAFCGFEVNEGEYKLMGLSAFGQPTRADEIRKWMDLRPSELKCATDLIQWCSPTDKPFSSEFIAKFGQPFNKTSDSQLDPRFADLASSVQIVLEEELETLVSELMGETGIDTVCFAGGVALNCNLNGRLRRGVCPKLYVPCAPGDAGSALGAALAWTHKSTENHALSSKPLISSDPYLGAELDVEFRSAIDTVYRPLLYRSRLPGTSPESEIATRLAAGNVLGHMFGRFEMGPRALGNRSILADPRSLAVKDRVNRVIKHREPFRPFAPAILEEDALDYFEIPAAGRLNDKAPERFMLATHRAKPLAEKNAPAAIHIDGTARVQVVGADLNPRLHKILSAFKDKTGIPVLLNTSLNVAGQPMASTVWSGLYTLLTSELDGLVIDDEIVVRR